MGTETFERCAPSLNHQWIPFPEKGCRLREQALLGTTSIVSGRDRTEHIDNQRSVSGGYPGDTPVEQLATPLVPRSVRPKAHLAPSEPSRFGPASRFAHLLEAARRTRLDTLGTAAGFANRSAR